MNVSRLILCVVAGFSLASVAFGQSRGEGRADAVTLSGTLHVIWGDPPFDSGEPPSRAFLLALDDGETVTLRVDDELIATMGGLAALNRKRVSVAGWPDAESTGLFDVQSLTVQEAEADTDVGGVAGGVSGSQRWVTILCRFADSTGTTPHNKAWFDTLMGTSYPGMDHFWRELSYNAINLTGSTVVGWYNLPRNRSYYIHDTDVDGVVDLDFGRASSDCSAAADGDVFFPAYMGINFVFNRNLDCCAWGGGVSLTLDGETRSYAATWMPPWGYENQDVMGQEMGHGFGLPHSSGPYDATYDSQWDVQSSGGTCAVTHAEYGCIGTHTNAYHKAKLGWIPFGRQYINLSKFARSITIERMALPPAGNYLAGVIGYEFFSGLPIKWYTVETRKQVGYDQNVPADAVLIHEVDPSRDDRDSQVVDLDGDGDTNDEGAQFLPGEWFYHAARSVLVFVEYATSTGYRVSLTNSPRSTTYVDAAHVGSGNGASTTPWNTISEGLAGVVPNGRILAKPGSYPGGRTIRKPMIIDRDGSSGSVLLGQ